MLLCQGIWSHIDRKEFIKTNPSEMALFMARKDDEKIFVIEANDFTTEMASNLLSNRGALLDFSEEIPFRNMSVEVVADNKKERNRLCIFYRRCVYNYDGIPESERTEHSNIKFSTCIAYQLRTKEYFSLEPSIFSYDFANYKETRDPKVVRYVLHDFSNKELTHDSSNNLAEMALVYNALINSRELFEHCTIRANKRDIRKQKKEIPNSEPVKEYTIIKLKKHIKKIIQQDKEKVSSCKKFHWVRGHFRLLRKKGLVWVRPHTRGNKKYGEVESGYILSGESA